MRSRAGPSQVAPEPDSQGSHLLHLLPQLPHLHLPHPHLHGLAHPSGAALPMSRNLQDEYTVAMQQLREDIMSLGAKAIHAGIDDGNMWQMMFEMLPDEPALTLRRQSDAKWFTNGADRLQVDRAVAIAAPAGSSDEPAALQVRPQCSCVGPCPAGLYAAAPLRRCSAWTPRMK